MLNILWHTYAWDTVCEIRWRFLGLALSKKAIHFEKLEKQTNGVDSLAPGTLLPRLNQLQMDVTSGGQIVIWTKLGQIDFSTGHRCSIVCHWSFIRLVRLVINYNIVHLEASSARKAFQGFFNTSSNYQIHFRACAWALHCKHRELRACWWLLWHIYNVNVSH